jgi:phenylacetate-coenzyme A ligase PaaK-like adenylate-forming protein
VTTNASTPSSGFDDFRDRAQAALFASIPEHVDRLGWDAGRIAAWQRDRLRVLLRRATDASPFHARRLAGIAPETFEPDQLPELPVMTKAEMMDAFDDVATDRRVSRASAEAALAATTTTPQPIDGQFLVLASGGSSGLRGLFAFDTAAFAEFGATLMRSTMARLAAVGGPPPGGVRIAMVGAGSAIHATGAAPRVLAGSPVEFVPVPVTQPLEDIVGALNELQSVGLYGYPSILVQLAHEQASGRLRIHPLSVTSMSETLRPHQRSRIREAFGVPIGNTYGSTEGLVGVSAPDDVALTFASDCCITELVDEDNRPVAPGQTASAVLVTNLFNLTQPLIRYRLDDRFVRRPNPENGHLRAEVEGRASELLRVGESTIHPLAVASPLTACAEVVDFHIQATGEAVHVAVVAPDGADTTALESAIVDSLRATGVPDPRVVLEVVDALHRHPQTGKLMAVR